MSKHRYVSLSILRYIDTLYTYSEPSIHLIYIQGLFPCKNTRPPSTPDPLPTHPPPPPHTLRPQWNVSYRNWTYEGKYSAFGVEGRRIKLTALNTREIDRWPSPPTRPPSKARPSCTLTAEGVRGGGVTTDSARRARMDPRASEGRREGR